MSVIITELFITLDVTYITQFVKEPVFDDQKIDMPINTCIERNIEWEQWERVVAMGLQPVTDSVWSEKYEHRWEKAVED